MLWVAGSFHCVPCQVHTIGWYGESASTGGEEAEEGSRRGVSSVGIKVHLAHLTEQEHLLSSQGPSLNVLIPGQVTISFLLEEPWWRLCLCLWGLRPKYASGSAGE